MKIGDKLRCTRSDGTWFTEGKEYTILSFDSSGFPNFVDDDGDYDNSCGYALEGYYWGFELVEGETTDERTI